jgi:Fe-S-cluster-containing hydrogenase component 2
LKHISLDQSKCFGCRICEIVCSLTKEKEIIPDKSRIKIEMKGNGKVLYHVCRKCDDPPCVKSCPIHAIEVKNGKFTLKKPCIEDCSLCVETCPYQAIVSLPGGRVDACDLCGECIDLCPVGALSIVERGVVHA